MQFRCKAQLWWPEPYDFPSRPRNGCFSRAASFTPRTTRCVVARLSPSVAARRRIVHRSLLAGGFSRSWRARTITSAGVRGFRPLPGASRRKAATPPIWYRRRQSSAVRGLTLRICAMVRDDRPSAASSTMRARLATRWGVVPARIQARNICWSASVIWSRSTPRPMTCDTMLESSGGRTHARCAPHDLRHNARTSQHRANGVDQRDAVISGTQSGTFESKRAGSGVVKSRLLKLKVCVWETRLEGAYGYFFALNDL